ncbi:methionine adenosyltransferase [Staphylococcus epidermidis]|nr:methionine adenosyltransferase [Staphylococcus epidermidis]
MTYNKRLFTSESVTEGHPDKIADQVSDEILKDDPNARVACETTVTTGMALISGEISTTTYVDIPKVVRETIKDIGYTRAKYGYDSQTMAVLTAIDEQSPDIAQGVDKALEYRNDISEEEIEATGAGDQGLMFGYATDETDTYMPLPIFLSHQLAKRLADVRKDEILDYLRPDGKVQVTVEYGKDDKPRRIDTIVVSTQHAEDVELAQIEKDIKTHVIYPTVDKALLDDETKFYINPTGRFVIGGPQGDAGLTGRKIIVDTYGGYARHGGGCFSGKDPTKVDRSAAYAARYVAKNIVAAGLAKQCEVQLAYAIGVAEPVSISINTFDTGKVSEARLVEAVRKHFDLRPAGIIKMLDLKQPIYRQTAAYGHFGRTDVLLPWEKLDKVNVLKDAVEIQ